jgi:thioredoxin-related protein
MHAVNTGFARARILAWLLLIPLLAGALAAVAQAAEGVVVAGSLEDDARLLRERRVPLLLFYSRADCRWCELVRHQHLQPLQRDPAMAGRVVLREIRADSSLPLRDFAGRASTHAAFAKARGVGMTPTLEVVDAQGVRLAEPLVGVGIADFYPALLERLIDDGQARLRAASP